NPSAEVGAIRTVLGTGPSRPEAAPRVELGVVHDHDAALARGVRTLDDDDPETRQPREPAAQRLAVDAEVFRDLRLVAIDRPGPVVGVGDDPLEREPVDAAEPMLPRVVIEQGAVVPEPTAVPAHDSSRCSSHASVSSIS